MIIIKSKRFRNAVKIAVPFFVIPLTLMLGTMLPTERRYIFTSLAVALLSLILFLSGFEKKKTGSRRMVLVSVMTALSVIGRFIPFFKPITAFSIIAATYMGSECGFLVGSISALVSGIWFGLGPWTPFQMLAWGVIGLFAGYFSRALKKSTVLLLIYGALSGVLFSLVMDVWTVLSLGTFTPSLYLSAFLTALPHTLLYSVSNVVFLLFLGKPLGKKLERIKLKYGI